MGRFRERLLLIALVTTLVSTIGLLVVGNYAPTADPNAKGWRFSDTYYPAVTGLIGALFSVGVVSLIVELFLRESYAVGLRRFLRLNSAVVKSGLTDLESESTYNASASIKLGSSIHAVMRDPQRWVSRHFEAVLAAAQIRTVDVTLLVPDPDSPYFEAVAHSLDYKPDSLRSNLQLAIEWIEKQWEATNVKVGSTISVSGVSLPLYEVLSVDDKAMLSIGRSFTHPQGEQQLALAFENSPYPGTWLAKQLTEGAIGGELWAGDDRRASRGGTR